VEVAVAHAGDDVISDSEAAVARGDDLGVTEFAGSAAEGAGEAVENEALVVPSVDHGVGLAGLAAGPPARDEGGVELAFAGDDVEMPGGFESGERVGDLALPEGLGGGTVGVVADSPVGGEFGCAVGVPVDENVPHATGGDGAVLGGVADHADGGA
jgi:hypothetical protein